MAFTKQICILDIRAATPGFIILRCCFWFSNVAAYPNPNGTSAYLNAMTDSNVSGLIAGIQAGTIVEETYNFQFPQNWISAQWAAAVEPLLLAYYNARLAIYNGTEVGLPDIGTKFGILHDSSLGWSA